MSIKILRQGLPISGYLKIGAATPKNSPRKGAPEKWDHLELTGVERDQHGVLCPDIPLIKALLQMGVPTCGGCARSQFLAEQYEEEILFQGLPTAVEIALPYDDPDLFFPHRLAYHRGRLAFCTGDGEVAERLKIVGKKNVNGKQVDQYGQAEEYGPCGPECSDFQSRRCKPQAKLRFMLAHQHMVGGCYEFRTTSWNSIANLVNGIEMIQTVAAGVVRWLPLTFSIAPQTVTQKDGGPSSTQYIARVFYKGTHQELLEKVHGTLQIRSPLVEEIKAIEAGVPPEQWVETEEEVQGFREEFDHENMNGEQPAAESIALPAATPPAEPAQEETLPEPTCTCDKETGELDPKCPDHGENPFDASTMQRSTAEDDAPPEEGFGPPEEEPEPEPEPMPEPEIVDPREDTTQLRLDLWDACKERSSEFAASGAVTTADTPSQLLRAALDEFGYEASAAMPKEKFALAIIWVKNAKVPEAA